MNLVAAFIVMLSIWVEACRMESNMRTEHLHALKDQAYKAYLERQERARTQCTVNPQSPPRKVLYSPLQEVETSLRYRRSVGYNTHEHVQATNIKGLQLFGQVIGTLVSDTTSIVPSGNFTVELWIKPEGGQHNPAVILAAEDVCSSFPDKGWELGLGSKDVVGDRLGHLYFSLQTIQDSKVSKVYAAVPYIPTAWSYVAVTYDGETTTLYIDGVQVSIGKGSQGPTFRKHASHSCIALLLGGSEEKTTYRGLISHLRLWNHPKTATQLKTLMHKHSSAKGQVGLVFEELFENLEVWEWPSSSPAYLFPRIVGINLPNKNYNLMPVPPPCGFTVCDDPDVVTSYSQNHRLRSLKKVRYRIVNVLNSDGSNPTVTADQIALQDQALKNAFLPYNITFELSQLEVTNSSLRRRTVIFGCNTWNVGDGICNSDCNFNVTAFDGGDCTDSDHSLACSSSMIGNGECNMECNMANTDWDGGDCCDNDKADTAVTCADPDSPFRAYMDVNEYKRLLQVKCDQYLTVFFASWTNKEILGVSTFPWEKEVFSELGGIILRSSDFGVEGRLDTLVHEVGHALGLWHVHRGISEVECWDPCFEEEPTLLHGDLCQDTKPTPANAACQDPASEVAKCGKSRFVDTPFRNYMSYADDSCTGSLTPQQTARIHCYLDLRYPNWLVKSEEFPSAVPPPPPLAPQVLESKDRHVKLSWIPPLNDALYLNSFSCHLCTHERALVQFATATISSVQNLAYNDAWQPHQATGPPDAEVCTASSKAWMSDAKLCEGRRCSLTLEFPVAVQAELLNIWINWNAHLGLSDVELLFEDGGIQSLGHFSSNCDAPLNLPLILGKEQTLKKVRLTTNSSFVSVDAVQLVSAPSHSKCSPCKPLHYKLHRSPPFTFGPFLTVDNTEFLDVHVLPNTNYVYRVQAFYGQTHSQLSPSLHYHHTSSICGDGKLNSGEHCDDGNLMSGDGCSRKCTIEKYFNCKGEPSVCYWHKGDGVCESFEKSKVVEDCGHYTPSGFSDQWATSVNTHNKFYSELCSPQVILGPPEQKPLLCGMELNTSHAWYPCEMFTSSPFWLKLYFPQQVVAAAVLIHLASDGQTSSLEGENDMLVELISSDNALHHVSHVHLSCSQNPLLIPISQDLSNPFFLTKGIKLSYTAPGIAIAGVQLRSSKFLNPVAIQSCSSSDLYSVSLGKCVKYECNKPMCPEPYFKNAVWECNGRDESSSCSVTCHEGYMAAGVDSNRASLVCWDGHWHGPEISCKPVECGQPSVAHADAVCPDGTTYGKTCNFKCRPPARLKGPPNSNQHENGHFSNGGNMPSITCLKSGLWSVPESHCLVSCPPPSAPDHSVLSSNGHICSHLKESYHYGHRCKFLCKMGYHVHGSAARSRTFQLTCNATGSWSGGSCDPVICPMPETFTGGNHNCTDEFRAGSICSFQCPGNKLWTVSRCEPDGVWNTTFQDCPSTVHNVACAPPPPSGDPTVHIACDPRRAGVRCRVSCVQYNHEPLVFDAEKGKEVALGGKSRITCSPQGQWVPNPQQLVCREKCNRAYIGDGYCDAFNNQDRCDWDGGDCCASTLKSDHVVKPFPASCTTRCRCLDPSAKENQAGT